MLFIVFIKIIFIVLNKCKISSKKTVMMFECCNGPLKVCQPSCENVSKKIGDASSQLEIEVQGPRALLMNVNLNLSFLFCHRHIFIWFLGLVDSSRDVLILLCYCYCSYIVIVIVHIFIVFGVGSAPLKRCSVFALRPPHCAN